MSEAFGKYAALKNIHAGLDIIVCGCGTSATLATDADCIRIGVNDIGQLFTPDYLVVINDKRSFTDRRWQHIQDTKAKYVFSHIAKPVASKNIEIQNQDALVPIKLGKYGGTNLGRINVDYTSNSPYVGVIIAKYLGAKRIGLIGVDFTKDHFFTKSGDHPLSRRLPAIITEYNALNLALLASGTELYNLSPVSRLEIPRMSMEDFLKK